MKRPITNALDTQCRVGLQSDITKPVELPSAPNELLSTRIQGAKVFLTGMHQTGPDPRNIRCARHLDAEVRDADSFCLHPAVRYGPVRGAQHLQSGQRSADDTSVVIRSHYRQMTGRYDAGHDHFHILSSSSLTNHLNIRHCMTSATHTIVK